MECLDSIWFDDVVSLGSSTFLDKTRLLVVSAIIHAHGQVLHAKT